MAQEGDLAALTEALKHANEAAVATLLGAHPTLLEQEGGLPLLGWAVQQEREDVVRALAQRGVNLEATSAENYYTALQLATKYGHEKVTRVLLEHGVQPMNKGDLNSTPLHVASTGGHVEVARLLLQYMKGQGLEEESDYQYTALYRAISNGHCEVVTLLLDHGANAHHTAHEGVTPIMVASMRGHLAVVKILFELTGKEGLEATDAKGRSALSHAIMYDGEEEMVALLLESGAPAHFWDREGMTPLMHAAVHREEVVQALLPHLNPHQVNARGKDGFTALHYAVSGELWHGWAKSCTLKALLLGGANPAITDSRGRMPRACAEANCDPKLRAELVDIFEVSLMLSPGHR
jgi:ankyrin